MRQTREVIVELLSQLSGNREAAEYLRRFETIDSHQFAVIKVGGAIMADEIDALASALAFLRHVGLFPIVLHGAGPQLNQALNATGIDSRFVDGLRFTNAEVLAVARPIIYEQSQRLVAALERLDVRARMIQHGVFECEYLDEARYGYVGKVSYVNLQGIQAATEAGALPIVSCFGETAGGQVLNVNADWAANALIKAVEPHKIVFLTPTGGLLDEAGQIVSAVNLVSDYAMLNEASWVHSGMQVKLQQVKQLLDDLPRSASVSITSAKHLTKELFTHRGSGTLIRRGETFDAIQEVTRQDQNILQQLLERCFGRQLKPSYLSSLKIDRLIWSSSHRAAAVITRDLNGIAYMDKFAVTPEAQGEGLGAALWHQIVKTYPQLYWRSRADNRIAPWYFRHADCSVKYGDWHVFGTGFNSLAQFELSAARAATIPPSWTTDDKHQSEAKVVAS